jgi:hypothetical protein
LQTATLNALATELFSTGRNLRPHPEPAAMWCFLWISLDASIQENDKFASTTTKNSAPDIRILTIRDQKVMLDVDLARV